MLNWLLFRVRKKSWLGSKVQLHAVQVLALCQACPLTVSVNWKANVFLEPNGKKLYEQNFQGYKPLIPGFWRQKQEDLKFKLNLCYTVRLSQKIKQRISNKQKSPSSKITTSYFQLVDPFRIWGRKEGSSRESQGPKPYSLCPQRQDLNNKTRRQS